MRQIQPSCESGFDGIIQCKTKEICCIRFSCAAGALGCGIENSDAQLRKWGVPSTPKSNEELRLDRRTLR